MNALTNMNQSGAMQPVVETAANVLAAQAKATIEARYAIAYSRPRNWDQVRQDILKECSRPTFANNTSALYIKPIGKGIEGLGIRFVEVAFRCMTNVLIESTMVFEDDMKEIHRVCVTDLESNTTYPMDVKVSKTVERNKPMDDGGFISKRKNSYGKDVFTVPAQDDDLLNKRGALISKAVRTLGLRIIPGDIQDESEEKIRAIRKNDVAQDPDAKRKKMVDAFSGIGVKAAQLTAFLGHDLDVCSPAEIVELLGIYGAIKDGEATWKTVMDNKAEQDKEQGKPESGSSIDKLNGAIHEQKAEKKQPVPTESKAEILPPESISSIVAELDAAETQEDLDGIFASRVTAYSKNISKTDLIRLDDVHTKNCDRFAPSPEEQESQQSTADDTDLFSAE